MHSREVGGGLVGGGWRVVGAGCVMCGCRARCMRRVRYLLRGVCVVDHVCVLGV